MYTSDKTNELIAAFTTAHARLKLYSVLERLRLKKADGDWIQGTFYEAELQKVIEKSDHLFRIDKILKYRGKGVQNKALVHWKGWPKKYDSWIPYKQLVAPQ